MIVTLLCSTRYQVWWQNLDEHLTISGLQTLQILAVSFKWTILDNKILVITSNSAKFFFPNKLCVYSNFRKHWPVPGVDLGLSEGGGTQEWISAHTTYRLFGLWSIYHNARYKARAHLMDFKKSNKMCILLKQEVWCGCNSSEHIYKLCVCYNTLEAIMYLVFELWNLVFKCVLRNRNGSCDVVDTIPWKVKGLYYIMYNNYDVYVPALLHKL